MLTGINSVVGKAIAIYEDIDGTDEHNADSLLACCNIMNLDNLDNFLNEAESEGGSIWSSAFRPLT